MSQVWYSDRRLSWPLVLLGGMVLAGLGVCIAMNPSSFFLYLAGELVVGFVLMNFLKFVSLELRRVFMWNMG